MWDIVWFLVKTFGKGFLIGAVLRLIIAFVFRSEVSPGGLVRSAIVFAVLYVIGILYVISQT